MVRSGVGAVWIDRLMLVVWIKVNVPGVTGIARTFCGAGRLKWAQVSCWEGSTCQHMKCTAFPPSRDGRALLRLCYRVVTFTGSSTWWWTFAACLSDPKHIWHGQLSGVPVSLAIVFECWHRVWIPLLKRSFSQANVLCMASELPSLSSRPWHFKTPWRGCIFLRAGNPVALDNCTT